MSINRNLILLCAFMLLTISLIGGNRKTLDSLLREMRTLSCDTNKVHTLQKVSIKYRNLGELDSSIAYAERAITLSDSLNFDVGYMNANQAMGNTLLAQGNLNGALNYFLNTLKRAESTGNLRAKSSACLNIGNVYYYLLQFEKALDYFKLSLKYKLELKQTKGLAFVYNNIGETYRLLNKREEALEYLNKAFKLWEETNDLLGMAQSLNNLGIIFMTDKDYEKAEINFKKAFEYYQIVDTKEGICSSMFQLGELYFVMGQYSKAEGYFKNSLSMANEMGFLEHISTNNNRLSDICKLTGREGKALEYFKAYIVARDSIRNSEITKKATIQEMEFKFQQHQALLKLEQDKKDAIVGAELTYQKKQRNYFIVGFALMILLAFFILWGYIQKRRTNIELADKNKTIETQKLILEEKQKEILDSINYAKRIQYTLLAHADFLRENIPNNFVYFKPKDIVSGDFYWAAKKGDKFYLAVCDSTGHGVPGAIMSLLNITSLEKAIESLSEPSEILNFTRKTIIERLKKDGSVDGGKDGMDASLISFDFKKQKMHIAAANNPVWIIRNKPNVMLSGVEASNSGPSTPLGVTEELELIEIKPDKMPIGKHDKDSIPFTQQTIDLQSNDVVYAITDGYSDQFGGPLGKKFNSKKLKDLLKGISHLPMQEQKAFLESTFTSWIGDLEQVDDVTIVGIRI